MTTKDKIFKGLSKNNSVSTLLKMKDQQDIRKKKNLILSQSTESLRQLRSPNYQIAYSKNRHASQKRLSIESCTFLSQKNEQQAIKILDLNNSKSSNSDYDDSTLQEINDADDHLIIHTPQKKSSTHYFLSQPVSNFKVKNKNDVQGPPHTKTKKEHHNIPSFSLTASLIKNCMGTAILNQAKQNEEMLLKRSSV